MLCISHLYIYPIKSLGGISIKRSKVETRGLQYDRRWMIVDENGMFLTQREFPAMAGMNTVIENKTLFVKAGPAILEMPLQPANGKTVAVKVWDDACSALEAPENINQWFSEQLGINCRAVYMPDHVNRKLNPVYAVSEKDITGFADGYPILLIGQSSLNDLNSRLAEPMPMDRFRPNIVFSGAKAFAEDEMNHFTINEMDFYGVKPCSRCIITCTNQQTAEVGKEPLKTLATYRNFSNKIMFGQNVIPASTGIVSVGDEIMPALK
ncbi:MAG: MOSC N-terminal beta barrel domain-containing protein [Ferruginibacter sp.]